MSPKPVAVENFSNFCNEYSKGTVFNKGFSSRYKSGKNGRVTALWPGSNLHTIQALASVRWKNFEYEYVDGNAFGWFGNGFSGGDSRNTQERTYYLDGERMLEWPSSEKEREQEITNGCGDGKGVSNKRKRVDDSRGLTMIRVLPQMLLRIYKYFYHLLIFCPFTPYRHCLNSCPLTPFDI